MQAVRVGLVQLAWAGSRAAMKSQYRELVAGAVGVGASVVCLPELSLSPYFPVTRDQAGFEWSEPLHGGESETFFSELARQHGVTLFGSLFTKPEDGAADSGYFNVATIHNSQGEMVGFTRKIHIPSGEGYNETDFFTGGIEYPVYNIGPVTVATPTCYDQWFPELARIYSLNGAEFIFYPTAIGAEPTDPNIDTMESWQTVMRGHAVANGVYIGAANRVGEEHGLRFYGSSFVCDPMGRIVAQAGRDTTEFITADLNPQLFDHWRQLFPLLRQRKPATYQRILEAHE
jgi:N-carbamoylputrescine amidase